MSKFLLMIILSAGALCFCIILSSSQMKSEASSSASYDSIESRLKRLEEDMSAKKSSVHQMISCYNSDSEEIVYISALLQRGYTVDAAVETAKLARFTRLRNIK